MIIFETVHQAFDVLSAIFRNKKNIYIILKKVSKHGKEVRSTSFELMKDLKVLFQDER